MDEYNTELLTRLRGAISSNKLELVKELTSSFSSKAWCRCRFSMHLNTLLQEAIQLNRKEIFDHLLSYHDFVDLERTNRYHQTALHTAMSLRLAEDVEYYVTRLVRKGVFLHGRWQNQSLIVRGMWGRWSGITQLFLSSGADADGTDAEGNTALHCALLRDANLEFITTLLYYGANPLIRNPRGYNAFELAVLEDHPPLIQEILFNYVEKTIHVEVLLHLAGGNSEYFHQLLERNVKCVGIRGARFELSFISIVRELFRIPLEIFDTLLRSQFGAITTILRSATKCLFTQTQLVVDGFYEFFFSDQIVLKINFLLESVGWLMVNFLSALNSGEVSNFILTYFEEAPATELLLFLFQNGLSCYASTGLVYSRYGFCDLFKFLLSSDIEPTYTEDSLIVKFICEPLLDVEGVLDQLPMEGRHALLRFYGGSEMRKMLLQKNVIDAELPLLQELARNVVRKYLARRFNIGNVRQFFRVIEALPIGEGYKKIITLETPLY